MKIKNFLILSIIVLIALFLRFYQLGSNPPSLTWDEAAWGYNAYSLGLDGRDEFGRFMPLDYLESFGDFKPPMYAYLDIIPVKILGLNEFSTRFPSAIFGVLTVFLTYFLTKRLFFNSGNKEKYALAASFILAVSPWHILLSRAAFEANVATFFLTFGIFTFIASVQEKKWYLIMSAISFVFAIYTFNTSRIVAPILVLFLAIIFRNKLLNIKKQVIVSCIVGFLILLPTINFLFSSQAQLRFKEVNIFSDSSVVSTSNVQIENDGNSFISKIIHNRRLGYATSYISHYFDNLSPKFLFINGDGNPKFSTRDVGQLYLWDLPFLLIGALFLFRKKEGFWWILPLWILVGIIPAATARETPHALRIEITLPAFQILTAFGLITFLTWFKKTWIIFPVLILFIFNFIYFYHGYFAAYPSQFSGEWQYGYKESINYVLENKDNYDSFYITTELGRPYIYYLFYSKASPFEFRELAKIKRDAFGFVSIDGFDKFKFSQDFSLISDKNKNVLYVNVPKSVPSGAKVVKNFYLLNGGIALVAYTL